MFLITQFWARSHHVPLCHFSRLQNRRWLKGVMHGSMGAWVVPLLSSSLSFLHQHQHLGPCQQPLSQPPTHAHLSTLSFVTMQRSDVTSSAASVETLRFRVNSIIPQTKGLQGEPQCPCLRFPNCIERCQCQQHCAQCSFLLLLLCYIRKFSFVKPHIKIPAMDTFPPLFVKVVLKHFCCSSTEILLC